MFYIDLAFVYYLWTTLADKTKFDNKVGDDIEVIYLHSLLGKDANPGIIMYDVGGVKQTIPFSAKAVQGHFPKCGNKVLTFLLSKIPLN